MLYIGFILIIGIPVMLSEFSIGRSAQLNAFGSFKKLAPKQPWFMVGFLGIVTAFAIASHGHCVGDKFFGFSFQLPSVRGVGGTGLDCSLFRSIPDSVSFC